MGLNARLATQLVMSVGWRRGRARPLKEVYDSFLFLAGLFRGFRFWGLELSFSVSMIDDGFLYIYE